MVRGQIVRKFKNWLLIKLFFWWLNYDKGMMLKGSYSVQRVTRLMLLGRRSPEDNRRRKGSDKNKYQAH